jgi:hypothetical protein
MPEWLLCWEPPAQADIRAEMKTASQQMAGALKGLLRSVSQS